MPKRKTEPTDAMAFDTYSFQITSGNATMLSALVKYSQMLDYVTGASEDELLNIDGLINSILDEGMTRRIKDLVKKHSFESADEFIDCMTYCKSGEDVFNEIKQHEKNFYQMTHDEILSQVPLLDNQKELPL